jgi:sulfofructose kinase
MTGRIENGADAFVMCVGAAALDLVLDVERLPPEDGRAHATAAILAGGGPAATAAVAMSRLGARVSFVGSVGADDAGQLIREGLARENVDV